MNKTKWQEEIEEETQEHRKRMRKLRIYQEVILLIAGVLLLIFGIVFNSTLGYVFSSFFIGWLIGHLFNKTYIKLHHNAEDIWRNQYFRFYNKIQEVSSWDGKDKQKKLKNKKK